MKKGKELYKKGKTSSDLLIFLDKMKNLGYCFLTQIIVDTKLKQVSLICEDLQCYLPCEIGLNGFIDFIDSSPEDGKTPICETKIRHIDLPINDINNPVAAVFSKTIKTPVNFGPCFICLYISIPKTNKIRGIGFHGCSDDTDSILKPTNGCIRLYNADLYCIRNLFFKNLKVSIV